MSGMIPYGLRDLAIAPMAATGLCTQCGAPMSSRRCAYCGVNAVNTNGVEPTDECPRCGFEMDSFTLAGDDVTLATMYRCPTCGYVSRPVRAKDSYR